MKNKATATVSAASAFVFACTLQLKHCPKTLPLCEREGCWRNERDGQSLDTLFSAKGGPVCKRSNLKRSYDSAVALNFPQLSEFETETETLNETETFFILFLFFC